MAAGGLAAIWIELSAGGTSPPLLAGQLLSCTVLAVGSAEHAKRLLEWGNSSSRTGVRSRVFSRSRRGRAIDIRLELDWPGSPRELWDRVANLPRFLAIDPFHEQVTLMRDQPAAGVDLALRHNAFGRRFLRFGRILSWREGRGYTFSDLSPRGPRHGFPHVFCIEVQPLIPSEAKHSRLTIAVRGKWTSRVIPAAIGRWWVWLVCREHARLLRKGL